MKKSTLLVLGVGAFFFFGKKEDDPILVVDDSNINPCDGVDCGQKGICEFGECMCMAGYTGDRCQYEPGYEPPVVIQNQL